MTGNGTWGWPKDTDVFEGYGRPCPICGALVPVDRQAQHEHWHSHPLIGPPPHLHDFVLTNGVWSDCTTCGKTREQVLNP